MRRSRNQGLKFQGSFDLDITTGTGQVRVRQQVTADAPT
jgi:hypothetical protein